MNAVANVAHNADDYELAHTERVLNAEMLADMQAGVRGTQAHAGKLEMLQAR